MVRTTPRLPNPDADLPTFGSTMPAMADEEKAGASLSLEQIWSMLRAHLPLSIGAFLALLCLSYGVIKILPKSYDATAALIVNLDTADPLAGRVSQGDGQLSNFFATQVELINNNVLLEPVMKKLKLQDDPAFNEGFEGDPQSLKDIVLARLRQALNVRPGINSQLLYVTATARSPALAADISNTVAEEYLHQSSVRTNAPTVERAQRYSAQLEELKAKVDATQQKVTEFRQRNGLADLGKDGDLEGAALVDLQTQLLTAQNARRQLESQQPDLRKDLDKLEVQMQEQRANLGPKHPKILQLQSEIDATRRAMRSSSASALADARNLEAKYEGALAAERKRLLERRRLQDDGSKLLLEQRLAQETYAKALGGADEVQFASQGNYKDVALVSRAEPPRKASKPNKMKLFMMAVVASLALALGGPFVYEFMFARRIRCRDDLERGFGIMTLAEFGKMMPAA